jgi:hypothetical protein
MFMVKEEEVISRSNSPMVIHEQRGSRRFEFGHLSWNLVVTWFTFLPQEKMGVRNEVVNLLTVLFREMGMS